MNIIFSQVLYSEHYHHKLYTKAPCMWLVVVCLRAYMSVNVCGIQTYSCTSIKTARSEMIFAFRSVVATYNFCMIVHLLL